MIKHFNHPILKDLRLQKIISYLPESFYVGGMVRNFLLNQQIKDIDITSALLPEDILKRFENTDIKTIPTGIEHGTITLLYKGLSIEHTTFRKDIKTDGRHAEIAFTKSLQEDALRRDFTINALYADQSGRIIDPTGDGLRDIKAKKVRFIGKPSQRIQEDTLRILRFFRFSIYYGESDFDEYGIAACQVLGGDITQLSKERITEESFKILNHPNYIRAIRKMTMIGIIDFLIPKRNIIHLASTKILESSSQKHLIRLAGLTESYHIIDVAFPLFRFSNKEKEFLHFLVSPPQIKSIDHALYYYGREKTLGLMILDKLSMDEEKIKEWAGHAFPIKGDDILNLGFSPGKIVGKVLEECENWWIERHFLPNREECLTFIKGLFHGSKLRGSYLQNRKTGKHVWD